MKHKEADDISMFSHLGNEKHFEKVYKRFYPNVLFYAQKFLYDKPEAEDMAMDTFRKLWENRKENEFQKIEAIYTWLMVTTRNACINRLRALNRIAGNEADVILAVGNTQAEKTIEQCLIDAEVIRQIMIEVEKLPGQCRKIFALHINGQRNKEIAEKLNISPHTVRNHLAKAVKLLRMRFPEVEPAVLVFLCLLSKNG